LGLKETLENAISAILQPLHLGGIRAQLAVARVFQNFPKGQAPPKIPHRLLASQEGTQAPPWFSDHQSREIKNFSSRPKGHVKNYQSLSIPGNNHKHNCNCNCYRNRHNN
jgi:hypothetical protein